MISAFLGRVNVWRAGKDLEGVVFPCKYYCSILLGSLTNLRTGGNILPPPRPPTTSIEYPTSLLGALVKPCPHDEFYQHSFTCVGPDSSVGVATRYLLDGPGIKSQWGARFSSPVQTGPGGPPSLLYNGYRLFPGGKAVDDHPPPCVFLLYLCILIVCLCIFIVPSGTLRLP